ncbi:MAG: YebC/PmpR family DNA-binding transcriptional regulator [Acidobacteriota bacterium]
MAGHSKWANIQHRKSRVDAARSKLFTRLIKEITVAARLGGGDPEGNPRLRAALSEARSSNVPNDNIDRAIKKGTGELEGQALEEYTYEGYGPGGVAVMVEAVTDNKNRTVSELRNVFSKNGGSLGENGCVAWMFERRGFISLSREALAEEDFMELALEVDAEDFETEGEEYLLTVAPDSYLAVLEELEGKQLTPSRTTLAMVPSTTVGAETPKDAEKVERLLERLEDHDDVQRVWANYEESEVGAEAS